MAIICQLTVSDRPYRLTDGLMFQIQTKQTGQAPPRQTVHIIYHIIYSESIMVTQNCHTSHLQPRWHRTTWTTLKSCQRPFLRAISAELAQQISVYKKEQFQSIWKYDGKKLSASGGFATWPLTTGCTASPLCLQSPPPRPGMKN